MKKLLAIAWTDVRIELSDRSSIAFLVILPLLFTWLVGSVLGGADSGEDSRFVLAIVNEDGGDRSHALISMLESSGTVNPLVTSAEEADRVFRESNVSVLTIPSGFEGGLLSGEGSSLALKRAANDPGVLAVEQAVQDAAGQLSRALSVARASMAEAERYRPFADEAARQAYFEQGYTMAGNLLKTPPVTLEVVSGPDTSVQSANIVQQSSTGQLVTWVLITLAGVSEVLVNEKLWGTLRRLVVAPVSKAVILGGKVIGRLGIGLTQTAVMVGFGMLVLGVEWGRSPLALVVMVVAFSLASVAFGVMLSTFTTSRNQAGWLAIFFGMVMAALGGAWWPLEVTPQLYQDAVRVLPTTWAMQGFLDVIVRGQDVMGVLPEAGVLLGFAAAFFGVGIWRFKFERL
jgi:ABC-2 type transport system permease protein